MLDPEYLAYCADEVESLFSDLETEILKDIARRIRENKYVSTSTAQYQISRAKAIGMQEEAIKKQLARLLNVSEKRVTDIINTASFMAVESDNLIFKEAYDKGIITDFNFKEVTLKKTILKGIEATNGEIRNICKTTAKTAKNLLADAMDQAYLGIQSGAFSQQEAIKFAVEKIAYKGIGWIDYKSGTHRRVDSAIRNAVRTGVNQTACRCQEKNFDEMGGNLVEVTSHLGARPSHAEWQGKIYWWKKPYKNYSNFEQTTGYGTGEGLGGWDCRHSFYPFFEGLSEKSFEAYRKGENDAQYELDQQQRYNERKIREWKRRQAVNKSGGIDSTREARKVREWEQRQRAFLEAHPDMKRNYARETIEKRVTNALTAGQKNAIIIKEIRKESGIKGKIKLFPSSDIDFSTIAFDDQHINGDRKHNVSKAEAISFMLNAKLSTVTWNGQFENFFSDEGAVYYDIKNHQIKTAFKKDEYNETVRKALEERDKWKTRR